MSKTTTQLLIEKWESELQDNSLQLGRLDESEDEMLCLEYRTRINEIVSFLADLRALLAAEQKGNRFNTECGLCGQPNCICITPLI